MADEDKTKLRLEIAHVLFMDIVGYSKLLIDEQAEAQQELNRIVRDTDAVREAEAAGRLIRLPAGDGMALVFTSSVEAPVECALQISQALSAKPSLPLRMGVHSGAVQQLEDVNGRKSVAGAGINFAQRVMDCGDAGHILVSKRVADDLSGSRRWQPYLHDLGDCEVKHGVVVSLVNLYADVVGNPVPPQKFGGARAARRGIAPVRAPASSRIWMLGAAALVLVAAGAFAWRQWPAGNRPPVTVLPALPVGPAAGPANPAPFAEVSEKSVAVLPFDDFSADKDSAVFADGVQDEVLTDLAKLADLKVISRSSVMQYKKADNRNLRDIGKALGVSYVVEGSVQRSGNKIRVTAQLIDARTDAHRWAEHYDRDLQDVFVIQTEIAQSIATQLQAAISPQERAAMTEYPTRDLQAYQLYVRALQKVDNFDDAGDPRSRREATMQLLGQATARDPDFVRAYVLMAQTACVIYRFYESTPAQQAICATLVEKVNHLRPGSAEAHHASGIYAYHVTADYARARDEFTAEVRLAPNDADAVYQLSLTDQCQGRWEDALVHSRAALKLDPEKNGYLFVVEETLNALGRYGESCTLLDHWMAGHPSANWAHVDKAVVLLDWKADFRAARAELALLPSGYDALGGATTDTRLDCDYFERDFEAAARDLAACALPKIYNQPRAMYEGMLARYRGDNAAAVKAFTIARKWFEESIKTHPRDYQALLQLGLVDAALGNKDAALKEGRQAITIHPPEKDARFGPAEAGDWAKILAWVGEREEAIQTLQGFCDLPNGPDYGYLKASPMWDPLRGDSRFDAFVVSRSPKTETASNDALP